ncbi:peptidoglycan-binding protein [Kitasatospora sp. RB6PN24]|uniref:peptidoglycan-binding domain-containing protein n=1 Tax=Kitasatospora humi TaxID=2893891 RepID=UPI001E4E6B98|nr:peptidoglycan-binding domain-containing protein [Kitasatospora humi]MCC9309337.1 peptidoglycan-binding protein [Kitasatospora humi]
MTANTSDATSHLQRRRRILLAVALTAALLAGAGLAATAWVKSPAERAAQAASPPLTVLTAPVTTKTLNPSVVVRGKVYPPTRFDVVAGSSTTDVTQLYLSKSPARPGDQVANGQLLAEVSGQPLFVLHGAVPAYRDLKPGETGSDVTQLQNALAELGYGHGTDDQGVFGTGTERAVTAFYRHLGYPAPTTGATTQQAVDTARAAVAADRQALHQLLTARPAAPTAPDAPAEPQGGNAQQIEDAEQKLAADQQALGSAEALNGPMVPAAQVAFLPTLPAAVTAVNGTVGAPVSGTLVSLTSGGLSLTGQLTPDQAADVTAGMSVEVLDETTGTSVNGKVSTLDAPTTTAPAGTVITIGGRAQGGGAGSGATSSGTTGNGTTGSGAATSGAAAAGPVASAGPAYVPVTVAPDTPFSPTLNGHDVRITILKDAAAAPVLCVPVAAVFTQASGQTAVTRVDAGGARTTIPVTTGVTADGFVGVTPTSGTLKDGDQVAVGQ